MLTTTLESEWRYMSLSRNWKIRKLSFAFVLISAFIISALSISSAQAYSGTGLGTTQNPYKIATCIQLQSIADSTSSHYKLVSDIDCSGTTTWNSGAGFIPIVNFSGELDGQNYSINNLFESTGSNASGLFDGTSGATIKNIHLRGGSFNNTNSSYNGSFSTSSTNTTYSSCSSTISILSDAGAGLVGAMSGGSMDNCWYEGTVTSHSAYGAGIASVVYGAAVISNVYSKGTVTESGPYGSGLIANLGGTATVSNSYSTSHVTAGVSYSGGLFAITSSTASISNVFYAGQLDAGATTNGAIAGIKGGSVTISGAYYDIYTCTCSAGVGSGTAAGTSVNASNATPNYFKNNSTNAPLNAWNFSTVWQTNATNYPSLRVASALADGDTDGVTNAVESSSPYIGDGNGDGIPDAAQTNVVSLVNAITGQYSTLASSCDSVTGVSVVGESSNTVQDSVFNYPQGLMNFTLHCNTNGETATVTQYFYATTDPGTVVARKYNSTSHTYQAIPGATIERVTVGGLNAIKVSYQITDGGSLDDDGLANGTIVDPAGLAVGLVTAPNTGLGGTFFHL